MPHTISSAVERRSFLQSAVALAATAALRTPPAVAMEMTRAFGPGEIDRQLATGNEIFLDHVGHFVSDAEAARGALARAGFAPAPVSIQVAPDFAGGAPTLTGTGNVTAMLRRGYLEMLFKTADTPLGQELDKALARYSGVHLAAFGVADAAQAHARLAAAGFPMRPLVQLRRPLETATGPATAAFTVARVQPGAMPEGRIQVLTHHTEDAVWQPRWLDHPNGAVALLDVVFAVADLDEAAARFARFTGRAARPNAFGRGIAVDRGGVQLAAAKTVAALLPELAQPAPPFAPGYGVAVQSLAVAERRLRESGLRPRRQDDYVVAAFPDELGVGAWIFVENGAALPWRR